MGSVAAELSEEQGAIVVAVSDATGGIYNPKGLPVKELTPGTAVSKVAFATTKMPKLCPTRISSRFRATSSCHAPSKVRSQQNADKIKANLVVEGQRPDYAGGGQILAGQRRARSCPDIFANAGGVVASYFEMGARPPELLLDRRPRLTSGWPTSCARLTPLSTSTQQKHKTDLRTAADDHRRRARRQSDDDTRNIPLGQLPGVGKARGKQSAHWGRFPGRAGTRRAPAPPHRPF